MLWFLFQTEEDGRVFPVSNSSSTVIDCLLHEAKRKGGMICWFALPISSSINVVEATPCSGFWDPFSKLNDGDLWARFRELVCDIKIIKWASAQSRRFQISVMGARLSFQWEYFIHPFCHVVCIMLALFVRLLTLMIFPWRSWDTLCVSMKSMRGSPLLVPGKTSLLMSLWLWLWRALEKRTNMVVDISRDLIFILRYMAIAWEVISGIPSGTCHCIPSGV